MSIFKKLDNWLVKMIWHKSDTEETLYQKLYLVRNAAIASIILSLVFIPFLLLKLFTILLFASPLLLAPIITIFLLISIKRGIKWFLYFYYNSYIAFICFGVMVDGGLPNSMGIWGGAFICFMHGLAIKDKKILVVNGFFYSISLIIIVFSYPYLIPIKGWTPEINNLYFTINEVWMCLFLVKSFHDSIVIRTNEAKHMAVHLQELDAIKSKLYANITHEFRTPLTLIRGNAEEIGEKYDGEISERANTIVQSSDKILFLVNQMLNLSKVEEGNVPMRYVQCDLVSFIRFVVSSFQGLAELQKIRLHYEPQCPQLIMDIEAEKLEESISNLLSNAIKYTPKDGDVFVTVHRVNMNKTSEQQVEISVRDTGIGIPEDQLDKIFIRFYRVEDKHYPYREGTGIGLTLVNEYIKLMKGSIRVKSNPGKGSEFTIVLPISNKAEIEEFIPVKGRIMQKEETGTLPSVPVEFGTNQPRLLIIEDNRELREYLFRLLGNDYQVITAENGIDGVAHATACIPDIILSDVMMPGKDGYQVCKELKNDFRTNHIPIVLLTARTDIDSRITGLEQGADAYLTKPFNKKELIICLRNLLVQRETLQLKFGSNLINRKVDGEDTGLNRKFLDRVVGHLEKNYKNDRYGIHQLVSDLGISRVQLHRKLTAVTGQSTSNFIRNFRLERAKKLLLETDKNISDIAFDVGIADAKYFSKAFVLEFGLTATELRNSFQ